MYTKTNIQSEEALVLCMTESDEDVYSSSLVIIFLMMEEREKERKKEQQSMLYNKSIKNKPSGSWKFHVTRVPSRSPAVVQCLSEGVTALQ